MCERRAVTNRLATTHRKATSPEKFRIPDDLLELTDCHRDQARAPELAAVRAVLAALRSAPASVPAWRCPRRSDASPSLSSAEPEESNHQP